MESPKLSHDSEQQQDPTTAAARANASKAGRQGSRKVRTGCSTCKVRRVKCDEGKPACQRCISTGRTCHGYQGFGDGKTMSRREILSYQGSLLAKLRDLPDFESPDEGHLFEFFFHVTAPSLALDLDSEFWRSIMPQFCHTEEPLRHAALALGGFHKAFLDSQGQLSGITCSVALEQYLRAIRSLRGRLQTAGSHDLTSMLLTTLLFVCIEYIQGNEVNALSYLQQGRQLMQHWTNVRHVADYEVGLLRQTIVPLYQRSSFTMCMFGACVLPIPQDMVTYHSVPAMFSSLDEARQVFYSVSDTVWHFISNTSCFRYGEVLSTEDFTFMNDKREALLLELSQWHTAFSLFQASSDSPKTLNPSALVMLLHYHAATIWLSASMSVGESCYDIYVDTFSTILTLGRTYLRTMKGFTNRPSGYELAREGSLPGGGSDTESQHKPNHSFIFDTHVIPILYFTAVKCRHPLLRKTALDLMEELTSTRENLWQGNIAVCVAKHLIDIETASSDNDREGARRASESDQSDSGPSTSLGHASCLGHNFSFVRQRSLAAQASSQFESDTEFRSEAALGGLLSENVTVDSGKEYKLDGTTQEPLTYRSEMDSDDGLASQLEETKLSIRSLETEASLKPTGGSIPAAFLRPPFGVPEYMRVTDAVLEPSKNTLRRIKIVRKLPGGLDQWETWEEWIETSISRTKQP